MKGNPRYFVGAGLVPAFLVSDALSGATVFREVKEQPDAEIAEKWRSS
jgi:hypothetical protein